MSSISANVILERTPVIQVGGASVGIPTSIRQIAEWALIKRLALGSVTHTTSYIWPIKTGGIIYHNVLYAELC
jgi:hypothetical protein